MARRYVSLTLVFILTLTFSLYSVSAVASAVSWCQTLSPNGSYELTKDINSSGTCITIGANDITLDCQGHMINYSQSAVGYGINNTGGYDNITVQNCNIVQGSTSLSSHAIYYNDGGTNGTISDNNITIFGDGSNGVVLRKDSDSNTVRNNNIVTSGDSVRGITITIAHSNTIQNNTINTSGDGGLGMYLSYNGSSNLIEGNAIRTTGGAAGLANSDGIVLHSNATLNTFQDNSITTSKGYGIAIGGASPSNNVTNNIINTASGFNGAGAADSSNYNRFENNTIASSGQGIFVHNSNNLTIKTNTITTSGVGGIGVNINSNWNTMDGNVIKVLGGGGMNAGLMLHLNRKVNTIVNNVIQISNPVAYVIYFNGGGQNNNTFYNNIFNSSNESSGVYFNNLTQANDWNITQTSGTNIIDGDYFGGNYWTNSAGTGYSDTCTDSDKDGFCDIEYNLTIDNVDYYPLRGEYPPQEKSSSKNGGTSPKTTSPKPSSAIKQIIAPEPCEWICSEWEECVDGYQTRTCTGIGKCEGEEKPIERQKCAINWLTLASALLASLMIAGISLFIFYKYHHNELSGFKKTKPRKRKYIKPKLDSDKGI